MGVVCPIACWETHTPGKTSPWADPPGRHPLGRQPPWADTSLDRQPTSACWDMNNKRVVHIPLECILVNYSITARQRNCGKVMFSQVSVCSQGRVGISGYMFLLTVVGISTGRWVWVCLLESG